LAARFNESSQQSTRARGLQVYRKAQTNGKPSIELDVFHNTVSSLSGLKIGFDILSGITLEQVRDSVEKMNDQVIGVVVKPKRKSFSIQKPSPGHPPGRGFRSTHFHSRYIIL
jgi:hypothetical protein